MAAAAGRALWIGPIRVWPPVLQAPMAGFTNYAYRQIIRQLGGAGLIATEMVSARGFIYMDQRDEGFPDRLWGVAEEARPLAVQIWDNDPGMLAAVGARLVEEFRVSLVDLNFGCPVKDISQNARSGSYLLRDPQRLGAIVERVVQACRPTPVTAKIRLGSSRQAINATEVARVAESAGAAAITVHGRTAADMYRGQADWDEIARIKPHLQRIPLIGNGDLKTAEQAVAALARYAVDGVMIGRAGLRRPWLFREIAAMLSGEPVPPSPSLDQQRQLLLEHYSQIVARFGATRGTILMRRYAACYAHSMPGARHFRGRIAHVRTPEEFAAAVGEDFPRDSEGGARGEVRDSRSEI